MNDVQLCTTVAQQSRATADWLRDELHVPFRDRLTHMGGHSVPRILSTEHTSGRDIIEAMLAAVANDQNIEIILNASVASLDRAHGRIAGASGTLRSRSEGAARIGKKSFPRALRAGSCWPLAVLEQMQRSARRSTRRSAPRCVALHMCVSRGHMA